MNRFFSFIAKYLVATSLVSGILLLMIAAGLIFNPALLETIFRYGLAVINIALACYLISELCIDPSFINNSRRRHAG